MAQEGICDLICAYYNHYLSNLTKCVSVLEKNLETKCKKTLIKLYEMYHYIFNINLEIIECLMKRFCNYSN